SEKDEQLADIKDLPTKANLFKYLIQLTASTNKEWGNCPLGKTVLGDDPCAKDYFLSMWLDNGEWQAKLNRKEKINHSSYLIRSGEKQITKNTKPSGQ